MVSPQGFGVCKFFLGPNTLDVFSPKDLDLEDGGGFDSTATDQTTGFELGTGEGERGIRGRSDSDYTIVVPSLEDLVRT